MYFNSIALTTALLAGSSMAATIWDGRFTATSAAEIGKWSWENQVGAYQYYIHGSGAITDYINISSDYANPADSSSSEGARITVDGTSSWNGQNMMRTELIPSTKAAINKGKKYYHFSLKRSDTNAPDTTAEHQIAFFESHFTELKYGTSGSNGKLQWMTDGNSAFDMDFSADEWHNVAYGIDFDANTVEFFHSTGGDKLVSKAGPLKASVSSNGADWHVGVLKFSKTKEDWYFSGVYIEDGELTTSVGSGGAALVKSSAVASKAPVTTSSAAAVQTTSTKAVSSVATTIKSSASAAPTTMKTSVKPVPTSTAAAQPAPTSTYAGSCAVEYVYV